MECTSVIFVGLRIKSSRDVWTTIYGDGRKRFSKTACQLDIQAPQQVQSLGQI